MKELTSVAIVAFVIQIAATSARTASFHEEHEVMNELVALKRTVEAMVQENALLRSTVDEIKAANIRLGLSMDSLIAENTNLESRVELLEAITRKFGPRTCQDLKNMGIAKSGEYLIDPDGPGIGEAPISAFCDLTTGATVVRHSVNHPVAVDDCSETGCQYASEVVYDASSLQIRALVELSEDCTQSISYDCSLPPPILNGDEHLSWSMNIDGPPSYHGDENQSGNIRVCGRLISTNMEELPVHKIQFQGRLNNKKLPAFELESFECFGSKKFEATDSCEGLRRAGVTSSGYYIVDAPEGVNYSLVKCNMDLAASDPNFQKETMVKMAEFPVAFDFSRQSTHQTAGTVVPYNKAGLNIGSAMTLGGVFTAPLHGVYQFAFYSHEGYELQTVISLRVDGVRVASELMIHATDQERGVGGFNVILALQMGQKVDVYLEEGWLVGYSNSDAHFTGQLLFAL